MPGTIRPPDNDLEEASWPGGTPPKPAPPKPVPPPKPSAGGRPASQRTNPGSLEAPQRLSQVTASQPRPTQVSKPAIEGPLTRICPECSRRFPSEFRVCPHDANDLIDDVEEEEERDELIGATLNDTYAIVRVLGEGGMGRVYEARHTRLSTKRFAIKVMHPEYTRQPEVVSRFQREAEA